MEMRGKVISLLRDVVRLFFPERCLQCHSELCGDEHVLCTHCLMHLPLCNYAMVDKNPTEYHFMGRVNYEAAASLLYFERGNATQQIVHEMKYNANESLCVRMGRMMGAELKASHRFDDVEVVVPVPLHPLRRRQRGYNQSELLCRGIAQEMGLEVAGRAMKRIFNTESQTHKDSTERLDNMLHAFMVAKKEEVEGRHVLLVDDVLTTGATLTACADALMRLSGTRVSIATLAIAR